MCGSVGFYLKSAEAHRRLGEPLVPKLELLSSSGPNHMGLELHEGDTMDVVEDVARPVKVSAAHSRQRSRASATPVGAPSAPCRPSTTWPS
jgi:hypothetical protein